MEMNLRKLALDLVTKNVAGDRSDLSDVFFKKLTEVAHRQGMNPADILLVMYCESGVKASAINSDGGAAGLNQMMPFVLKNLGLKKYFRNVQ